MSYTYLLSSIWKYKCQSPLVNAIIISCLERCYSPLTDHLASTVCGASLRNTQESFKECKVMLVPLFSVSVLNSLLPVCLSELVMYHCSPCSSLQIYWLPCYLKKELSTYPLSIEPLLFFLWPSDRDVPCLLTSWLTSGLMAQMSRHQRGFP